MAKKAHVSETPATQLLRLNGIDFSEHPYEYLEHGGAQHSAAVLGLDPFSVVKTLVMQDQDAKPLVILMHGDRQVSTKNLARQIGAKKVEPCKPEVAQRHSGLGAGPAITSPSLLKLDPWHGHLNRPSASNQLGVQPRWVQRAQKQKNPFSSRTSHTRWVFFHFSLMPTA